MTSSNLRRAGAGAGALALVAAAAVSLPGSAQAQDPLAVFSASATASPYGIVSRVPAETFGGYLFSGTSVNLGKARALSAGLTFGELGDLFIVSSAPPGTITQMPTVITAQEPPQELSPNEASFSGGRSGSASTGEARNFDLQAKADKAPSASATAAGQAVTSSFYSSGFSTSASDSHVTDDGTVVAKAVSAVQDILIGPAGAQLSIASATSLATITLKPGEKPVTQLQTRMYGMQLGGVPVTFDQNGLTIDKQVALPASAIASFNSALEALAAQGLTFAPAPRTETVTKDGAALSGGAFVYRYVVPKTIPRPSDIGTDETFTIASVTAAATARARAALDGPPPPTDGTAAGVDSAAAGTAPGAAVDSATGALLPGTTPGAGGAVPLAPATVALSPAAGSPAFFLPARVADPLPQQFRDSYNLVLLAGLIGLVSVVLIVRKRPI